MTDRPIVVAGAGAIGCFVGGMLASSGRHVALLVRPRVKAEIERFGLQLTDFDGSKKTLQPGRVTLSADPSIFHDAGFVLVTVKSADTADVADQIAQHAPPDAVIISLQNGVGNVAVLRERLGGRRVLAGMVPFNVIAMGEGRFHRATSGDIHVGEDESNTAAALSTPGLVMRASADITAVQWGKLIINLNNALSALSDMPLAAQLASRDWRKLFADQMEEGLATLKAAGITPVSATPIPMKWSPVLLRLPDVIFNAILGRTMKIDPEARSSMWQDLKLGRKTEIDYLQGAVIALAERNNVDVPLMRRIVALIKEAEAAGNGPWAADATANPRRDLNLREDAMSRCLTIGLVLAALCGASTFALARPPTVINSPGYDRRLQESRSQLGTPAPVSEPAGAPAAAPKKAKKKKH